MYLFSLLHKTQSVQQTNINELYRAPLPFSICLLFLCLRLSVCLLTKTSKTTERIFMRFSPKNTGI